MATVEVVPGRCNVGIHHVLIGTDLSHQSEAALRCGLDFSRLFGAEAEIVYVLPTEEYVVAGPEGMLAARDAARRDLLDLQAWISRRRTHDDDAGYRVTMLEGAAADCVLQYARDKKADLIVLGTHGRSGLGKVLLGSVAEKVFRRARAPVLTVGPNFRRPQRINTIREILAPCDLSPKSHPGVRFACALARQHHAKLTVLHVVDGPNEVMRLDPEGAKSRIECELMEIIGEPRHEVEVHCHVECGKVAQTVLDVASEQSADLIVLGVRPSAGVLDRFMWPIAYELVRGAACPVLTLRGQVPAH
jgi:nucleotide-binding universal stress UspA family protein